MLVEPGRQDDAPWVMQGGGLAPSLVGGAIIVAALYFGQELLVPLVLATLLAFVLAPAVSLLGRMRLPRVAAVLLTVAFAFALIGGLGAVVGQQGAVLAGKLPQYEGLVLEKWNTLTAPGGILHGVLGGAVNARTGGVTGALDLTHASVLALAGRLAQPILGPLATTGVVLIFTLFILLYSEDLRDRFVRLVGRQDLHRTIFALNDAGRRLSRYFLSQLIINASFGLWIGTWLTVLGVPGAVLWGLLATMMRFVPFLGTFVALLPPLAIAIATAPGWSTALIVLAVFLISEAIMGQVIEPLTYGHSTGLSPVAIVVATSFWALLWGFVGLLIATPLTVCLVVIGRHVERLSFFDVIFGDTPPLLPAETFYQRGLEGRSATLEPAARQQIAASSRADYYDHVVLDALVMAQRDRARNVLSYDRLDAVHAQFEALLMALDAGEAGAGQDVSEAWHRDGAVLCLPGRGQLDDLAARMAVQVLRDAGFGAHFAPNLILDASGEADLDLVHVRLCCLSVLEDGATPASIRLFVRRMQKKMPDAIVAVGLWRAPGESPLLAALRAEGKDEHLVLSIGELVAFARAVSVQREPSFA